MQNLGAIKGNVSGIEYCKWETEWGNIEASLSYDDILSCGLVMKERER